VFTRFQRSYPTRGDRHSGNKHEKKYDLGVPRSIYLKPRAEPVPDGKYYPRQPEETNRPPAILRLSLFSVRSPHLKKIETVHAQKNQRVNDRQLKKFFHFVFPFLIAPKPFPTLLSVSKFPLTGG
jgi:hypothetical protein